MFLYKTGCNRMFVEERDAGLARLMPARSCRFRIRISAAWSHQKRVIIYKNDRRKS